MRLLLDTCTLIWLVDSRDRLSTRALELTRDRANEVFVSVGSLWEIVLKSSTGRLQLSAPPDAWFHDAVASSSVLAIEASDVSAVAHLGRPTRHADPFDRLLIATAQARGLAVLTPDRAFRDYPIPVEW